MFCSLCIQSFAKKLLIAVLKDHDAAGINLGAGGKYLHEPVQLFAALSSCFDPITNQDGPQLEVGPVKGTILHGRWPSNRIPNLFQYLEFLFAQENPTANLSKSLTNASPMANIRLKEMSPRLVGHSRTRRESDGTKQQEKVCFNRGNIDGALYNIPGEKRNERYHSYHIDFTRRL